MPSDVSPLERKALEKISDKLQRAAKILAKYDLVVESTDARKWYRFLKSVKDVLGNLNNDVSFAATLLAKKYLAREHPNAQFDAAPNSHSAPGLDIDVPTSDGKRSAGEVKPA